MREMNTEIKKLLEKIREQGRGVLTYEESRKIIDLAGLQLNKMALATNAEESIEKAREVGYPVALKIVSEDVIHKSDVGGVKVGIKSDEELKKSYEEMMVSIKKHYPTAKVEGVSIEEMVKGTEVLIGSMTDSQFGKMIALGIGGIFTEIYKDVTFRLIPITKEDVKEMMNEIKGKKIFEGFRGLPQVKKEELTNLMMKISKLVEENPIIKEMDLNPVVATEKGLITIDARIILE